jgi:hypothetical protein
MVLSKLVTAIRKHFKASFVLDTALRQNYSFDTLH